MFLATYMRKVVSVDLLAPQTQDGLQTIQARYQTQENMDNKVHIF